MVILASLVSALLPIRSMQASSIRTSHEYITITPEVIAAHQLTPQEYEKILRLLGREPTFTELGIFSVMWSEHCSYKSSRIH